jgi:hypothetical protein
VAAWRFASSRAISRKRVAFARCEGEWRGGKAPTFLVVGRGHVEVSDLYVNLTPGRGWVRIASTPLTSFVRNHLSGEGSKAGYADFLATSYGFTEEQVARQVARFEALIDSCVEDDSDLSVLVRIGSDRKMRVADGAHRATIAWVRDPRDRIACRVVVPVG